MDIVGDLRARTRGEVLGPRDGGYEAARAAYNALATGQPACIFRPADVSDIVAAVRWAGEVDLPIGVRGGGHSVAGHSSPNGALLVDLSRWRGAVVDPVARTAEALAGSRLMDLDAATAAYTLAAPSGEEPREQIIGSHEHKDNQRECSDLLCREKERKWLRPWVGRCGNRCPEQ